MSKLLLLYTLLGVGLSITCTASQNWVSVKKYNGAANANQESWAIFVGSVEMVVSTVYSNSEARANEYCLPQTTNQQYEIELRDSGSDYWYYFSWIEISGINDNIVFKQLLHDTNLDRYPLSLYSPINKNDASVSFTVAAISGTTWTEYSYTPTSDWNTVTLGSISGVLPGTQFFRRTFVGVPNLAAFELSLNYRYGIVVYLNGQEIYRDNMNDGDVTATTLASGMYTSYAYRVMIRNGYHINASNSVVAFSLHFISLTTDNTVEFNMYLSQYAKSLASKSVTATYNCWVISEAPTLSASSGASVSAAHNWNWGDYYNTSALPYDMYFEYTLGVYEVNGFENFPYTWPTYNMNDFTLYGSPTTGTSASYTQLFEISGLTYDSYVWYVVKIDFAEGVFKQLKLNIRGSNTSSVDMTEFHPTICNCPPPTSFTYAPYNVYVNLDEIYAMPSISGISQCTSINLPAGLSISYTSCIITGTVTEVTSGTFSVQAASPKTIPGTIVITAAQCQLGVVNIRRMYGATPANEIFTVYNAESGAVIFNEEANTNQVASTTRNYRVCATANRLRVVTGSITLNYWNVNSFILISVPLDDTQYETILRTRYDEFAGINPTSYVSIKQQIPGSSTWKYSFTTPGATWYNDVSTWTNESSKGSFPSATNQYQLYGKTFQATASELQNAGAFTLCIRYQYGIIVYLNDNEAFRNNVAATGGLNTITASTGSYSSLIYRIVSLPTIFMSSDPAAPGATLIQSGTNTIAIGLVAPSTSTTTSSFDATLRLFGSERTDRIFDFTAVMSGMYNTADYMFSKYYGYHNYYTTCATNYDQITFNDDRREWISSFAIQYYYSATLADYSEAPKAFKIQAKNANDATWETLYDAEGKWKWWAKGQTKHAFLFNNRSFNMYRILDVGTGNPSQCTWRLGEFILFSDKIDVSVPDLSYTPQQQMAYRFIEMAEAFPEQLNYYSGFSTEPELPAGIYIDPPSGVIGGTPTAMSEFKDYVITATKISGATSTFTLNFGVIICHGEQSLITFVIRTDTVPANQGWKLYNGKTPMDSMLRKEKFGLPAASTMYYVDECLPHAIYSARFYKSDLNGWYVPGSFAVSVDESGMRIDLGFVAAGTVAPTFKDTTFTSYIPWQIEYTNDWQVLSTTVPLDNTWMTTAFTASSSWEEMTLDTLATRSVTQTAIFIRRKFNIASIEEYPVMNIRARYSGGFVAFLNGKRFARFNMDDYVTNNSESYSYHNENVYSKFHVILLTEGGVSGDNVIAFQHHRSKGASSSVPHMFDSTAVLGVNECNMLSDTLSKAVAVDNASGATGGPWTPTSGTIANAFDHDLLIYLYYRNTIGTAMDWEIENLDKSRWNSYFIMSGLAYTGYGWTLYAKHVEEAAWTDIATVRTYATSNRGRERFDLSIGMAGFKYFRFELDVVGSSAMNIYEFGWQYCKLSGTGICPADDEYPSVGDQESSPGDCGEGFTGYTLRKCSNGSLAAYEDRTHCRYKPPEDVQYDLPEFNLVKDIFVTIPAPYYRNIITKFSQDLSDAPLPAGLTLNEETGEIKGTPIYDTQLTKYTVRAGNPTQTNIITILISIRTGRCTTTGIFQSVTVGETAKYSCAEGGSFIGEKMRSCKLGEKDGEWQAERGSCTSIPLIVFLVILGIVAIFVVIILVIRSSNKSKRVGGVGRSGSGSKKTASGRSPVKKGSSGKSIKV